GSPRRQGTMGDRTAQTRFERLSKQSNEPPLSRVNTLRSGEDNMKLQELMDLCTKLFDRVLDLENVKDAQALEIKKMKKRVKNLESKKKSRTPQLKRRLFKVRIKSSAEKSLGDPEDASKQGGMKLIKMKGVHGFKRIQRLRGGMVMILELILLVYQLLMPVLCNIPYLRIEEVRACFLRFFLRVLIGILLEEY
ncbi:hypothetical protein Tco_1468856, partial [Tanacetum coccineum]